MKSKMAEVVIHMECGGKIVTYFPVKSEKHMLKKLKKSRRDRDFYDFGHFRVNDAAVTYATAGVQWVH